MLDGAYGQWKPTSTATEARLTLLRWGSGRVGCWTASRLRPRVTTPGRRTCRSVMNDDAERHARTPRRCRPRETVPPSPHTDTRTHTHTHTHTSVMFTYDVQRRLGSRVVSVLDSGAEGPGFKSQPRRCRVTLLGKLFTPIVALFTKQRNW